MELRFWRTKRGEEVDFVLVKDRQPYPIEVKTRDVHGSPPPGLRAFCKRYPKTKLTFTISTTPHDPRIEDGVTHSFLEFKDVPRVLEIIANRKGEDSETRTM